MNQIQQTLQYHFLLNMIEAVDYEPDKSLFSFLY